MGSTGAAEIWINREAGPWEQPIEDAFSLVTVHAVLMHTGKVLYFSFAGDSLNPTFADLNRGLSQVFAPLTRSAASAVEVGRNLFCAGQCTRADGRVFSAGGQSPGGAAPSEGRPGAGSVTFLRALWRIRKHSTL
jgi:hypothetical protein